MPVRKGGCDETAIGESAGVAGQPDGIERRFYRVQMKKACALAAATAGESITFDSARDNSGNAPVQHIMDINYSTVDTHVRTVRSPPFKDRLRLICLPHHLRSRLAQHSNLRGRFFIVALVMWPCRVPPGTVQQHTLRRPVRGMRFERRLHSTRSHQHPPPSANISSSIMTLDTAAAFIPDDRFLKRHLPPRYPGNQAVSHISIPTLVEANLVFSQALQLLQGTHGHFFVFPEMIHFQVRRFSSQTGTNGCHTIPLSGSTDFEPGDFFGVYVPPLVQVPLSTLGHPSLDAPPPFSIPNVHALHYSISVARYGPPSATPLPALKAPSPQLLARLESGQRTSCLRF